MKYLDKTKWLEAFKHKNWYELLADDYKTLEKQAESLSTDDRKQYKEELYSFIEHNLENKHITLATTGPNLDEERQPVDTIVIHHTKNLPGMTWQRLSAMHLIRLYATYYNNPTYEPDKYFKGQAIWSNHFRGTEQVFYAYHWLVRHDGSIERLLQDDEIGWQAGNWEVNTRSVAICIDNDLSHTEPSAEVIKSIAQLIHDNYSQVDPQRILGHGEVNPNTACPGDKFISVWKTKVLELF